MRLALIASLGLALLAGPLAAQTSTEVLRARAAMSDGDPAQAVSELRRLAEAGDPLAQTIYGSTFYYGDGGVVDAAQVIEWHERAAAQGYGPGISDLGWYFRYGMEGLEPDLVRARAEFERAAALGYPRAAAELASMLFQGLGGPADEERAVLLIRWAADMGDAFAAEQLANEYLYGGNLDQNDWEARRLYMLAAAQRFYVAQERLGYMAMNGYGGAVDLPLAQDMLWQSMSYGNNSAGSTMAELLASHPDLAAGPLDAAAHCIWAQRFAWTVMTPPGELTCLPILEGLSPVELKEAGRTARELVPAP